MAQLARRFHGLAVDRSRLHRAIGRQMQRVDELDYGLRERWRSMFDWRRRRLDAAAVKMAELDPRWKVAHVRRRLDACEAAASQAMKLSLSRARGDWARLDAHFRQLSPLTILERGYAIVERDGNIVKSPEDAPVNSEIRVRLARGELKGRVLGG